MHPPFNLSPHFPRSIDHFPLINDHPHKQFKEYLARAEYIKGVLDGRQPAEEAAGGQNGGAAAAKGRPAGSGGGGGDSRSVRWWWGGGSRVVGWLRRWLFACSPCRNVGLTAASMCATPATDPSCLRLHLRLLCSPREEMDKMKSSPDLPPASTSSHLFIHFHVHLLCRRSWTR